MRWIVFPLTLSAMSAIFAKAALAIDPFVIKDIRVEGLQRTEAGTVFSYLPVRVGDTMSDEKAAETIRALFATGFFRDVAVESDGDVLVVVVQERPSIAQVDFTGVKEFDKDTLNKAMRSIGLTEGRIFDRGIADRAEQEMKRQYLSRGKYAAEVTTTVTPLERNRVSVNFTVVEGDTSKIRNISVIGAKAFSESQLRGLFNLREPGWLTWYSKADQYSRQKLSADLETLRSWYQDRGYLEFNIDSTQVSITPDKKDIYITVSITEGEKYTVSDVKFDGQMLIPEAELRKLLAIKPGDVFSRARVTESTKKITDRLGNDGYAFANVNAAPELDKEKRQAAFTFIVDPGRRVYVRRVNVAGNSRTRDEVIRREMRQMESAWYNAESVTRSKQRIDKLGYFSDVNVENPAVQGTTDQVDVNFTVVEKPTGNVLLGAGFGSGSGLILSGSIAQQNIFGSGKHVGVQISSGKLNSVYSFNYTNPYFTEDGVSLGYDIYHRKIDAQRAGQGQYVVGTTGTNARFGVPISELDTIQYGVGYEDSTITVFPGLSPLFYTDYVARFGSHNTAVTGNVGWVRDGRDSLIYPTKGVLQRAFVDGTVPLGTLRYYRTNYQYQQYIPVTREYTFMWNTEFGYGGGYGGKELPFFKNYYAGGVSSLRGYRTNSVAPRDANNDPRGGTQKVLMNVEFLFPFPGLANDKSVRMSTFIDAGTVIDPKAQPVGGYRNFDSFRTGMRASTGLGLAWVSPFGPLKFILAAPLSRSKIDQRQVFQFTFGGVF